MLAKERKTPVHDVAIYVHSIYSWAPSASWKRNIHCRIMIGKIIMKLLNILSLNGSSSGLKPIEFKLFCATWRVRIAGKFNLYLIIDKKLHKVYFFKNSIKKNATFFYAWLILFARNKDLIDHHRFVCAPTSKIPCDMQWKVHIWNQIVQTQIVIIQFSC